MSTTSTKATSGRSKLSLQSGTSDIPTPTPEASPEEVRAYLAYLLTSKRKVPDNDADRIVSPWRIGSGQEMRSYSPAMYLKVFGDEQGWILYREVHLAMSRQQVKNQTILQACWPYHLPALPVAFTTLAIIMFKYEAMDEDIVIMGMACGIMGSALALLLAFIIYLTDESPETKVDSALRACTKQVVTKHE